jgi:putative phosphoesterase
MHVLLPSHNLRNILTNDVELRGESGLKVGVISDTHARYFSELPQNLVKALSKMDLIVHAGDVVTLDVVRGLETLAPVKGVCGNMDFPEIKLVFPDEQILEIEGRKIGVVHGNGGSGGIEERVRRRFPGVDAIIFGHSHDALNRLVRGILLFNPGSAGQSYGVLEISGEIEGTIYRDYY